MTVRIVGCPWPEDDLGRPVADRATAAALLHDRISRLPSDVPARIGVLARTSAAHSLVSSRLGRAWLREAVSCVFSDRPPGLAEVHVGGRRCLVAVQEGDGAGLLCDAVESLSQAGICLSQAERAAAVA